MLKLNQEILIDSTKEIVNILDLPLKSRYRALIWHGTADGTNLTLGFNIADIRGKTVVLKSFAIYPYGAGEFVDFFVEDSGATEQWSETIPVNTRINRLFDGFEDGAYIKCLINDISVGIFQNDPVVAGVGYPLDLSLDNIFYKFDAKIQTWNISVEAQVQDDIFADSFVNPKVKVVCECYLL